MSVANGYDFTSPVRGQTYSCVFVSEFCCRFLEGLPLTTFAVFSDHASNSKKYNLVILVLVIVD